MEPKVAAVQSAQAYVVESAIKTISRLIEPAIVLAQHTRYPESEVRFCNAAFVEVLGHRESELTSRPGFEVLDLSGATVIGPYEPGTVIQRDAITRGKARRKGGAEFNIEISCNYMGSEDDFDLFVLLVHRAAPIPDRFIESSLEGFWQIDENGITTYANRRLCEMFGYAPGEMIGHSILEHCDEQGLPQVNECLARLRAGGSKQHDFRFIDRNGRDVWTICKSQPVFDPGGNFLGATASLTDITDRVEAENKLRTSEQFLSLLVRQAAVGVIVWDLDFRAVEWNLGAQMIFGYSPEEMLGQHARTIVPADTRHLVDDVWASLLSRSGGERSSNQNLTKDGRLIHCEWYNVPLVNADGTVVAVASIVDDTTERIEAEKAIRRLNEELEARVRERTAELELANKELEAFTYTVSHDLRTPLRALDGFSQILLEDHGESLPPDATELLDRIRHNSKHMGRLVEDLLRFSRTGRQQMRVSNVAMGPLVQGIYEELLESACGRKVNLTLGALPTVKGDPSLLRQVVQNLMANAFKFTDKKQSPKIVVGVKGESPDSWTFFIKDNGTGFDPQYSGKLFQVFERLHSDAEYEGTGVGLAIVKRIVQRHGGKVWAESSPGKGATFFFSLPK